MFRLIVLFIILQVHVKNALTEIVNTDVNNLKVSRKIDLSTHLPRIITQITFINNGKVPVDTYLYSIESGLASKLSYIGASISGNKEEDGKIEVTKSDFSKSSEKTIFKLALPNKVESGRELNIEVDTSFAHSLQPFPSQISQSEKQFVKFVGDVYFYSPYSTKTQTTVVTCSSSTIDSYTKEKPVSVSEKVITYGPYENVEAFKEVELELHYENNTPFLTVTDMTRLIEVSHWGNIAVEETFEFVHSGALLKGSFSRYDYQRMQEAGSSVKSFKTLLPLSAKDVYYRDEIGNISTSHLRETDEGVELELRPRFPLFGGWRTQYYIGYNIPSYQYLFNKGDKYALVMKFVDHIFDDQVIDHVKVKIILPEGASDIKVKTPYPVQREKDTLVSTYLDTIGRPVITMTKKNLVDQHIQDFELHYTFPKYMMLQEPLLVFTAFFLLFLTAIVYVRLDFSITKDEASESRMRIASLLKQALSIHDCRSALYQSYEDCINKFKAGKDMTVFKANQKKIDADHKNLTHQIASLQQKLKSEGSDIGEKVQELQRLDTQVREQINLAIQNAEKLVNGRLTKQQYLDIDATIRSKREDLCHKMDLILSAL